MAKKSTKLDAVTRRQFEAKVLELIEAWLSTGYVGTYYVVATEVARESGRNVVRVYVERLDDKAITIDECGLVSEGISDAVDVLHSKILGSDDPYVLEVSSPGLFRELQTAREFDFYKGHTVKITVERTPPGQLQSPLADVEATIEAFNEASGLLTLRQSHVAEPLVLNVDQDVHQKGLRIALNPALKSASDSTHELSDDSTDKLADETSTQAVPVTTSTIE